MWSLIYMKVEMKEYDNHCQLPSLSEVTLEPDFVKGKNGNLSREKCLKLVQNSIYKNPHHFNEFDSFLFIQLIPG